MFTPKLLILGFSLIVAGTALLPHTPPPDSVRFPLLAGLHDVPVTDLPALRVTATAAESDALARHPAMTARDTARDTPTLTLPQPAAPAFHMPYYSFGSASPHILEKD